MKDVYSDALKIILARRRTKKEVADLLVKKGYEPDAAAEAVERYAGQGYIDEADYAMRYAHDAARIKGYGKNRIKMTLREKGVSDEHIDRALEETNFDLESEIIKKYGGEGTITYKEMNKRCAAFIRRGFSQGEVTRKMKELYQIKENYETEEY